MEARYWGVDLGSVGAQTPPMPCIDREPRWDLRQADWFRSVLACAWMIGVWFPLLIRGENPPAEIPSATTVGKEASAHWAYQPLQLPIRPDLSAEDRDWCRGTLDEWIVAGMRARGLRPARDADRAVLGRRLSFDLIGLPPDLENLSAFVADPAPDDEAIARWVDRLLASPRFGEHWARHWMDIARYAESVTLRGLIFKEAWRYREYLVDAFNRDVPIDHLIREQLAGDLMPATTVAEKSRKLVATTFLMLGNSNLEEQDKQQLEMDVVDEQLDVIGKAFLGQTIGCARCHDHKFDPISARDYYALAGILKNIIPLRHDNVSAWVERPLPLEASEEAPFREHERQVADLEAEVEAARRRVKSATNALAVGKALAAPPGGVEPSAAIDPRLLPEARELRGLESRLKVLRMAGPIPPKVMAPLEATNVVDMPMLKRGSVHSPAGMVARGFPKTLATTTATLPSAAQSGRMELAEWIVSPGNALTRRVMVNRFWVWMMGEGLVRTPDNFGTTGEAPTHPELLEALAERFGRERGAMGGMGWSAKALVREIALSRTYRQQSIVGTSTERDPDNRWWSRALRKTLTGEQLRDAILAVGGGLDFARETGPGFPLDRGADYGFELSSDRRSVFLPQFRNALPEIVTVFDGASPSMVTGRRDRSVVAPQALYLMNEPWVMAQARRAATVLTGRMSQEVGLVSRLVRVHREVLGREPTRDELILGRRHFDGEENSMAAWASWMHALLASIDFRTVR